jgi:hypothetical protein
VSSRYRSAGLLSIRNGERQRLGNREQEEKRRKERGVEVEDKTEKER